MRRGILVFATRQPHGERGPDEPQCHDCAAHKSLPFGSKVRVVDQRTGKSIMVTINDRGPFVKGRIIDLSKAAATKLGFRNAGHTKVCIERV